ncbi:protein DNA-DAMAGE INDUCIBLE 1-like [Quercus robur]|uniref:protein DNA-DAMAGE INDUCIBLE 1-like n=1 Tax=Quercus robur TaxID=38942 RepID=UPI0021634A4B|nr:protein DNA-DAMAGE INDUCIBLE 1-like [Quercus robur]XP_050265295.1 protein DNA-DAMAGE INDUCIBLE 1-like [Quercus robur]
MMMKTTTTMCFSLKNDLLPITLEKDIPSCFLDEERLSKQASRSGTPVTSGTTDRSNIVPTGGSRGDISQGPNFEAKVAKLVELGFGRKQSYKLLNYSKEMKIKQQGFFLGIEVNIYL